MPRRCPPCRGQGERADRLIESLLTIVEDLVETVEGRLEPIIKETR